MTEPVITDPTTQTTTGPQTFGLEYVQELRRENEKWRKQTREAETTATTATTAAEAAKVDAEARIAAAKLEADTKATETVTTARTAADARVINAEVKAAAVKAGMVDLDGLKMVDLSSLKLNDKGEVEGIEALLTAAKTAKPYLFAAGSTSSTATTPPPKDTTKVKSAREMTDAEFDAAVKSNGWRNK